MAVATLSPSPTELHLDGFEVEAHSIIIQIATKRAVAACPSCGAFSDRVHSRYTRTLADLPWHGVPVRICLRTRHFFCSSAAPPPARSRSSRSACPRRSSPTLCQLIRHTSNL